MNELLPGRAGTDERFSHELMNVLGMLARLWLGVAEPRNGSPACGLHVVIYVSAYRVREACGHATYTSFKDLNPVILRVRCAWCDEQASWLVGLRVVHVTSVTSPSLLTGLLAFRVRRVGTRSTAAGLYHQGQHRYRPMSTPTRTVLSARSSHTGLSRRSA